MSGVAEVDGLDVVTLVSDGSVGRDVGTVECAIRLRGFAVAANGGVRDGRRQMCDIDEAGVSGKRNARACWVGNGGMGKVNADDGRDVMVAFQYRYDAKR